MRYFFLILLAILYWNKKNKEILGVLHAISVSLSMTELKKQLASLSENERLVLAQELIQSLSEHSFNRFVAYFFASPFIDRIKHAFQLWQVPNKKKTSNDPSMEEGAISGAEMKEWIRQQIAESESRYAEKMKTGQVNTFTLAELKAELNG